MILNGFVKPVYFCIVFVTMFGFKLRFSEGGNKGVVNGAFEGPGEPDSVIAMLLQDVVRNPKLPVRVSMIVGCRWVSTTNC